MNNTWIVFLETTYTGGEDDAGVLHKGTKEECELVFDAFMMYNSAHRIKMEELKVDTTTVKLLPSGRASMYVIYEGKVVDVSESFYPPEEDGILVVHITKYSYESFEIGVNAFYTEEEADKKLEENNIDASPLPEHLKSSIKEKQ